MEKGFGRKCIETKVRGQIMFMLTNYVKTKKNIMKMLVTLKELNQSKYEGQDEQLHHELIKLNAVKTKTPLNELIPLAAEMVCRVLISRTTGARNSQQLK